MRRWIIRISNKNQEYLAINDKIVSNIIDARQWKDYDSAVQYLHHITSFFNSSELRVIEIENNIKEVEQSYIISKRGNNLCSKCNKKFGRYDKWEQTYLFFDLRSDPPPTQETLQQYGYNNDKRFVTCVCPYCNQRIVP